MKNLLDRILTEPLRDFLQILIEFMPDLLSAIIILIIGFITGWILKNMVVKTLTVLNLNQFCKKMGITEGIEKVGIKESPAALTGRLIYWLVVIIFIVIALYTLKIPAIEELFQEFFLYLPNLFIAVLLVSIGYIMGNFLGRATLIASVNAGITFSSLLS